MKTSTVLYIYALVISFIAGSEFSDWVRDQNVSAYQEMVRTLRKTIVVKDETIATQHSTIESRTKMAEECVAVGMRCVNLIEKCPSWQESRSVPITDLVIDERGIRGTGSLTITPVAP